MNVYEQIQKIFARNFFFFFFNHTKVLFIDINTFKRWKFDARIYYNKFNFHYLSEEYSKKFDIQSVLLFSRLLINFETKYWSIELKMTELIWIVKRIRHIIKNAKKTIVILIDHAVNALTVKQTTLNNENTDKFNLRLIWAFAYFSQLNIDVKYKADKTNIISNALSKLSSINFFRNFVNMNILNIDNYHNTIENIFCFNHAFLKTLVSMISKFEIKLIDEYFKKKTWFKIVKMLKK